MAYGKIKFDTFVFSDGGVEITTDTKDIPTQAELALKDSIISVNAKLASNVVNEDIKIALKDDITAVNTKLALNVTNEDIKLALKDDITSVDTKLALNVTNEDAKLALKDDITSVDTKLALNVTNEDAKLATKADLVSGKLPVSQLPDLAIINFLGVVATQTAMLTLTGEKGDWCTRSDNGKVYVITGSNPGQLSSWTPLSYPAAPVSSVAGRTGAVVLNAADVSGLAAVATSGNSSDLTNDSYTARTSTTGSSELPAGTAAQRDASPSAGYIRFNTDVSQFEGYTGSSWSSVGGGATGGGSDTWAIEHDNTITASYTISTGKNVISAGRLTINSGATVTVPTGSNWVIV